MSLLDDMYARRRRIRVQSGALVIYADEICDAGTCTRPPGHAPPHSQFDGPDYADCVEPHPPEPDPVELLQAKLDAAEGRKAPADGWYYSSYDRCWLRRIDDAVSAEVYLGCNHAGFRVDPDRSDRDCPPEIEAATTYDCILAVEAWIKEKYP